MPDSVMVAGPYIGELGWEVFSFQPLVRGIYMAEKHNKCIVYTRPGRRLLYDFAEVRTLDGMPEHEAECHVWHGWPKQELLDDYNTIASAMMTEIERDFPEKARLLSLKQFGARVGIGSEHYDQGRPDILKGDGTSPWPNNSIIMCIRDRAMTEERNWPVAKWRELIESIVTATDSEYPVILLGKVRNKDEWTGWKVPEESRIINLLNSTTIDDCINTLAGAKLAIGGSSGLVHLASRCACPHLTWGTAKNVLRFSETNWFGTPYHVIADGWNPNVDTVASIATTWITNGEWPNED